MEAEARKMKKLSVRSDPRPLDHEEFEASCWSVIRRDGATVTDTRPKSVEKLAGYDAATFLELMAEVPHDVAAIFSGSFTLRSDPHALLDLERMSGRVLMGWLLTRKACEKLPLIPTHEEAGELFINLLESVEGAELYRAVTLFLVWGRAQPGLSVYLTPKEERQKAADTDAVVEPNEPANDDVELADNEPGSLFSSRNEILAEMAGEEE